MKVSFKSLKQIRLGLFTHAAADVSLSNSLSAPYYLRHWSQWGSPDLKAYIPPLTGRGGEGEGAGFAAHYRFIELITIRIITLNVGWGAGRFSVHIARSDFSPEWRGTGYWICQAWTLWQRNELHKVSWGWVQFAALILICLQHWEICTTYWTNNKGEESGEKPPEWPPLFFFFFAGASFSEPAGHAGYPEVWCHTQLDAMNRVIVCAPCLEVVACLWFDWVFFFIYLQGSEHPQISYKDG